MSDQAERGGIFAGTDPFALARAWLAEAEASEPNDPNAIALATVDADGMPIARMVLLKDIEDDAFVFYTNYESRKAAESTPPARPHSCCTGNPCAARIRARGTVTRPDGAPADAYYRSRSLPIPPRRLGLAPEPGR